MKVNGLVCAFCAQGVEKKLRELPATADVYVSLEKKRVAVALKDGQDIPDATLVEALTDASAATLVCCVLLAVLAALGAGATLAGLVSAVPQLIWLSACKALVFGTATALPITSGRSIWRARKLLSHGPPSCTIVRSTAAGRRGVVLCRLIKLCN